MEVLRKDGVVESIGKIRNFVKRSRAKQNGPSKFSLQDLVDWANQHKEIPADDNKPFVTAYNFTTLPERDFKVLLTTKRLIHYANNVSTITIILFK